MMLTFQRFFGRRTARCSLRLRPLGWNKTGEVSRGLEGTAESERQDRVSNAFDEEAIDELTEEQVSRK